MRRLLMTVTALAMAAGTLALAGGTAHAADCFTEPDNDDYWYANSDPRTGYARFKSYGERIDVWDEKSNGRRTVMSIRGCEDGGWRLYGEFSSGPDEGATDHESHNLGIAEGRRVMFSVCERSSTGGLINCGDQTYGHA